MTTLDIIKAQFELRIYTESVARINKVLDMLIEDEIWYRPNEQANSIGNLVLHLCGNVTQWIGYGIGDFTDARQRDAEFDLSSRVERAALKQKLIKLKAITDRAMATLTTEQDLLTPRVVQGFEETKLSIIVHVIEHFSYHTGQIAMIAKYLKAKDLGFYDDMDLTVVG